MSVLWLCLCLRKHLTNLGLTSFLLRIDSTSLSNSTGGMNLALFKRIPWCCGGYCGEHCRTHGSKISRTVGDQLGWPAGTYGKFPFWVSVLVSSCPRGHKSAQVFENLQRMHTVAVCVCATGWMKHTISDRKLACCVCYMCVWGEDCASTASCRRKQFSQLLKRCPKLSRHRRMFLTHASALFYHTPQGITLSAALF